MPQLSLTQVTLIAIGVVNLITFITFGIDKRRARKQKQRISEATLIGMSFCTGLFGGWLAMKFFRHKTVKTSFKVKMVLVSICNVLWPIVYLMFQQNGEA